MKAVKQPVGKYADGGTTRYPSRRHARWRMPATMDDVNPNANVDNLTGSYADTYGLPGYKFEGNPMFEYESLKYNNTWPSLPEIRLNVPAYETLKIQAMQNALEQETTPVRRESVTRKTSAPVRGTANRTNTPVTRRNTTTPNINPVENNLDLSGETISRVGFESAPYIQPSYTGTTTSANNAPKTPRTPRDTGRLMGNIGDLASTLGQLAPVVSNLFAKPESFDTVSNPYSGQILSTMANRRYDTAPARRAIRENRAISNYNASQSNTNTGADMAYRL